MTRPSFSILMQAFFAEHLAAHKRASPETICSYRDTFRLLLNFVQEEQRIMPSDVAVSDLDSPVILSFLDHLEVTRHNSVRSRNLRLAAIRSFFRYIALRDPESLPVIARVLAIPVKRADHRVVSYLTRPEMDAILASPNRAEWIGRRDHALLLTFYNTGARLSELKGLKRSAAVFGATASLHLHGKGRKDRQVPLWPNTARILRDWFSENARSGDLAFPNARNATLSSDGVAYILKNAVNRAIPQCPSLSSKRITPHVLRHTTAMHLLQSGVDIAVIALWLGHETIETTHIYLEADLVMKEKALGKLTSPKTKSSRFKPGDRLISFLSSL